VFDQALNLSAHGEMAIREALIGLGSWGAGAVFQMTEYQESNNSKVMLVTDWKELVTQVSVVFLTFSQYFFYDFLFFT
jgi:hypothetical protein